MARERIGIMARKSSGVIDDISFGFGGTPKDIVAGTQDIMMTWDSSNSRLNVNMDGSDTGANVYFNKESALTTGTIRTVDINQTMTGASYTAISEAFRVTLTSEVMTGDWANAIVGRIDYGTAGDAGGGMAAPICSELNYPAKGVTGGAYYVLDLEMNCPTNFVCDSNIANLQAFMNVAIWGDASAIATWEDNGFLFRMDGFTSATGNILNDSTIRVRIGSNTRYLILSSVEDTLTFSGDVAITGDLTVTGDITLAGAVTNDIMVPDDYSIIFGTDLDVDIKWEDTGSELEITFVADNTDILVGTGTLGANLTWLGGSANYSLRFDCDGDTNGALYIGADQYGLMFQLFGDVTGCGVFWDPSGDTNGELSIGASGGSKGNNLICYGDTNGAYIIWDNNVDDLMFYGDAQLDFANITLTPNANRTYRALHIGNRTTEKDVTMAGALTQNMDPVQMNFNIIGVAPTGSSTFNGIYQQITHDSIEMPNLRLKGCDWTITAAMNCMDAYVVQTELIVSGTKTSGGELMAMSALTTLGSGARTADRVCALQAMISGSGTAGTVVGDAMVFYAVNGGTVITTDDIIKAYNQSAATVVDMIEIENDGTCTNMLKINNDLAAANGILFEGNYEGGSLINMTGANVVRADAAEDYSFISIGGYLGTPVQVTLDSSHFFAKMISLENQADAAWSLVGEYTRLSTGGNDAASAQMVSMAQRLTVDADLDSAYGIQSHMTVSGTKASSELISVSALATLGTGARTADRVCALQAMITGSGTAGTVTGDAIVGYFVNGGTVITTDDIIKVYNQSAATVVDMVHIENDGACTNMLYIDNDLTTTSGIFFAGAFTNAIDLDNVTMAQGIGNAVIRFGVRETPLSIAMTDAIYPLQISYEITANPGSTLDAVAACFKIQTDGSNHIANAQINPCRVRMIIDKNVDSAYGVQSHATLGGTIAASEIHAGSFYTAMGSTAAITADRVTALQAWLYGDTGAAVTGWACAAHFSIRGNITGIADSIIQLDNQNGTVAAAIGFNCAGAITYAFDFEGSACDAWTSGDSTGADWDAQDEYCLIPVKVQGITPTLYILAAETYN